ncbi:uncharacterized protein LOC141576699, partial [Camelus bactrianus]|uniref:Uncharacterized protein LOC141576699 n=1 Tax=Camelus bactrianus TaxID=9837 RepID=A0AC58Q1Q4_CAMBA
FGFIFDSKSSDPLDSAGSSSDIPLSSSTEVEETCPGPGSSHCRSSSGCGPPLSARVRRGGCCARGCSRRLPAQPGETVAAAAPETPEITVAPKAQPREGATGTNRDLSARRPAQFTDTGKVYIKNVHRFKFSAVEKCGLPELCRRCHIRTALHLACASGQSPVVDLLTQWWCDLNARDKEGKTALIKAVQCRKEVCVTILLKRGADPNLADDCQNTALHYAVLAGNTSIAAELLRYDANIEAINKYNLTPFLLAVRKNKEEMVKFLIANGANVHAVDKLQRSALMLAVRHDSPDVVKLLLQRRVNADLLDVHGQSAERYACSNGFKQ